MNINSKRYWHGLTLEKMLTETDLLSFCRSKRDCGQGNRFFKMVNGYERRW